MFDLTGKVALVTGASRGIGRDIALSLAEAGANLILWGRNRESLAEVRHLVEERHVRVTVGTVDVCDQMAVGKSAETAIADMGHVDILVVNAGTNRVKPFLEFTQNDWNLLIWTNLNGALNTIQSIGKHMTARGSGSIIAMSSIYGSIGAPGNSVYCMTKGGLSQLARCLSIEWARFNVRVNSICPGWIETEMTRPYMQDDRTRNTALKNIPLARFGQPSDIGPLALYLASDEAKWVTGQEFFIDGGQSAR